MECSSFAVGEVVKHAEELSDQWSWSNLDSMVGKPYPSSILVVGLEEVAVARQKARLVHLMVKIVVSQEVVALQKTEAGSINYIALQVEVGWFPQLSAEL